MPRDAPWAATSKAWTPQPGASSPIASPVNSRHFQHADMESSINISIDEPLADSPMVVIVESD